MNKTPKPLRRNGSSCSGCFNYPEQIVNNVNRKGVLNIDEWIEYTMKIFYSNPEGWTTNEIYLEYLDVCHTFNVEPKPKNVVIRAICKEYNCQLQEVRTKYFVRGGAV